MDGKIRLTTLQFTCGHGNFFKTETFAFLTENGNVSTVAQYSPDFNALFLSSNSRSWQMIATYLFGQSLAEVTMNDLSLVSQEPQFENLPVKQRETNI